MDEAERKLALQLGAKLRTLRQGRAWTQAVLAERAGVTTHYVALLETARKLPTLKTLGELARVLGVGPGDLLGLATPSADPWAVEVGQIAASIPEPNRLLVRDILRVAVRHDPRKKQSSRHDGPAVRAGPRKRARTRKTRR